MFSVYPFLCDDWDNIYTLSYCHYQIGSMNYYPLFRVRSWNNGVRRMPFVFFFISISNELDIIIHVIHCDAISIRLWRHQQNENRASETRGRCEKVVVLSSFMYSLCHVRNEIIYVLSWRTVFELTHKITSSCALKHFGTSVHIIFSIINTFGDKMRSKLFKRSEIVP